MNAYEATKRLYNISEELEGLSSELGMTVAPTKRERLEKKIDSLEVEFFSIKHTLEKIHVVNIG